MAAAAFHVHTYIIIYCACVYCVREIRCGGSVCMCVCRIEEAVVCGDGDDYKMPTDWSQERPFYVWMCVYGYLYRTHTDTNVCMCVWVGLYTCVFVDVKSSHMRVPDRQKLTSVSCVPKRAKVLFSFIRVYCFRQCK